MLSDWINLPLQHLRFWKLPFISFSLFDFIKGLLKFYSNQKPFPDVSPTEHSSWGVTCVCVYYINTAHEPSAPWASQLQQKKRRRQPEHHLTVSNWIKYWTDANLWECYRAIITSPIGLEKKTCTVSFFLSFAACLCESVHFTACVFSETVITAHTCSVLYLFFFCSSLLFPWFPSCTVSTLTDRF